MLETLYSLPLTSRLAVAGLLMLPYAIAAVVYGRRLRRFVMGPPPPPKGWDRPLAPDRPIPSRLARAHAREEREHRQALRRTEREIEEGHRG